MTDREQEGLIGPVQTLVEEKAEFSRDSAVRVEGPRVPVRAVRYDINGNMLETAWLESQGVPYLPMLAALDGPFVDLRASEGTKPFRILRTYDAAGEKLLREVAYANDGSVYWEIRYAYDEAGNRTEQAGHYAGTSWRWRYVFTRDSVGNETADLYQNDALDTRYVYKHDARGRVISSGAYGRDGSPYYAHSYAYDDQGRRVSDCIVDAEGNSSPYSTWTYDAAGNVIEEDHGGAYREVFEYDSRGNVTRKAVHTPSGRLTRERIFTYEYDGVGNWIKRTTSSRAVESGQPKLRPIRTDYRTITYYSD